MSDVTLKFIIPPSSLPVASAMLIFGSGAGGSAGGLSVEVVHAMKVKVVRNNKASFYSFSNHSFKYMSC